MFFFVETRTAHTVKENTISDGKTGFLIVIVQRQNETFRMFASSRLYDAIRIQTESITCSRMAALKKGSL